MTPAERYTPGFEPAALSVTEAAAYIGVSRATLYRITAECGTSPTGLRPLRVRGRRLFLRKDLDAYLLRQRVPSNHSP